MNCIKKHTNTVIAREGRLKQSIYGRDYFVVLVMMLGLLIFSSNIFAQQDKKYIIEGNKQYENKNYTEAEKSYQQALGKNKNSYKGTFNLGDAYYKQGKYEEAAQQYQLLTHRATSKDTLAKAYHNLGNALLKSKKYEESITAYKNALKNNPNDDDTRYNLSYAQQMLKQQQQQNKDNKDNKDKKDDKKDQNKDKDKNEDKKKDEKKKQDKEQQQPEKNQISKEDAKRLLDALQNDEKNLQDKMKKEKAKGVRVEIEKDW